MAVWFRRPAEVRMHQQMGPVPPLVYPSMTAYTDIDLSSAEASLQAVAVRSAVDLIASLGSELPVDVFRGRGVDAVQLGTPSWLDDPGNDGTGLQDWAYRVLTSWLLRGNVFGDGRRATGGHLVAVDLFHPDRVHGWVDSDDAVHWSVDGQDISAARLVHRRVNPMPGNVFGLSPVRLHAAQIGVHLTATQFGLQWFRDGAHPGGILANDQEDLSGDKDGAKARTVKERFIAALRGTREPVVLGRGWSYQAIQVAPNESQFLETLGASAYECARIFGPGIAEILGYAQKGASLTYSNLVDRDLHVLKYALNKWLRRLERFLSEFLPRPQYAVINRDALLETSTLQRYQAHQLALASQWKTVNEVRPLEGLPPVPWGDQPVDLQLPPVPDPEPTPGDIAPDDDDEDDATTARSVTEMVQKVYLGVGKVVTAGEARGPLNRAGARLPEGFMPQPEPSAQDDEDEEED